MTDLLNDLAAHDPARGLTDPPPDMALFERLVATPAPASARSGRAPRRVPRRVLVGIALAGMAAATFGVASFDAGGGGGPMDLAAKAYADTAPNSDVVHSVEVTTGTLRLLRPAPGMPAVQSEDGRVERWLFHDRSHTIMRFGGKTYDQVLGADGALRIRLPSGEVQTVPANGGGDASAIVGSAKVDPVSQFRQRFAAGQLNDAGATTFAGHNARAYARQTVDDGATTVLTFYVDEQDGTPLGMREQITDRISVSDVTTVLSVFEHLPATDANLASVAG